MLGNTKDHCWTLRLAPDIDPQGNLCGFCAVTIFLGKESGKDTRQRWREHRLVVASEWQGLGLGLLALSEAVAVETCAETPGGAAKPTTAPHAAVDTTTCTPPQSC
jgi:GNAT superfamily N-acetyltransferase